MPLTATALFKIVRSTKTSPTVKQRRDAYERNIIMKRDKWGLILVLMLFTGVCVLLYPSISQYWNSRTQTKAVENYNEILASYDREVYERMTAEATDYNTRLAALDTPLLQYDELENYNELLDLSGIGIMGYITIEKLGVELPIYHGTDNSVLNTACGHLEGTSLPIGGESTHSVISAHRGLPHAKLFTDLDKLEIGDVFTITYLDRTITYQVDKISVVVPNDVNELGIIDGEDHCTLLTCTPYGINSHRLLVRGTRIENIAPAFHATSNAFKIDSLVATPVVAAPILLILLIVLMVKYREKGSVPLISDSEEENDLDDIL